MKILVAADGSKDARHALNYLVRNPGLLGKAPEIHLVHVRAPLPGRIASALSRATVNRYYQQQTNKALAAARRVLESKGIRFTEVKFVGEPGDAIAAYATRGRFSLIVLGSHGHGVVRNLLLGSVTSKVLARCKVPVLVVR